MTRTSLAFGNRDGEVAERKTVITLTPALKQPRLTGTQFEDLQRIRASRGRAVLLDNGRIHAALWAIPPAAAKRLLDRGLAVISETDGRVVLGITGMLAAAAHEHQTWTTHGSNEVADNGRAAGWHYFFSACCTCGGLSVTETSRGPVRLAAARHLVTALTSALTDP